MQILRITDPQTWDRALLALPNPHVLQSWAWGEFKSSYGWGATRLLFQDQARTVAAASVLQRKLPLLPISILYVPKGPLLDWKEPVLAALVLDELERLARYRKALFIKVDPDVYFPEHAPAFCRRPANAPEIAHLLGARGWRLSDEQIQFRNTVLLDLNRSEEALLAEMKQKARYNIRLAMRRGVTIRQGTATDLNRFYELYAETSQRNGFAIRPAEYYRDAWSGFMKADQARLLLAEVKGEAVAGLMIFTFGATAWYMYGASSSHHRNRMPNNLLQWEAIRQARAAGCTLYDLWGAPDQLDESDPMWGVVRFKLGLGGQLAQGLGAWDFPIYRTIYRLYTDLMPRYLDWLRSQNQVGQSLSG
jgi:peptidoglycan pentaglycine glycine transferase (the first glycine)